MNADSAENVYYCKTKNKKKKYEKTVFNLVLVTVPEKESRRRTYRTREEFGSLWLESVCIELNYVMYVDPEYATVEANNSCNVGFLESSNLFLRCDY